MTHPRLSAGTRLGPYRILEPIGAGGMGDVYKAADTKLDREVAIKILPDALAQDPERLARFEYEAKVLASLNHPNIAQIYGVEDRALVMELVPGRTLSDRLGAGPVALNEALRIAGQIAEALAAAHEKGIIHRDLKPANVMVTPAGRVKLLDFGLAKPISLQGAREDGLGQTVTGLMTQAGMAVGTPGYMSPEQARGQTVDTRTDTWALGCVLYELLTNRRAFPGATLSDIIATVLQSEPDWDALPANTPPRVRDLLRRCLRKDVRRRVRDAGDIALEIEDVLAMPDAVLSALIPTQPKSRALPFLIAAIAIATAALAGGYIQRRLQPPAEASLTRLTASLPLNDRFLTGVCPNLAVAPDGKSIAYIGIREGKSQLFLRSIDSLESTALPGTEGASDTVFFSPDGIWVGFLQGRPNVLRKVPIGGGAPVTVATTQGCGADWAAGDQIFFGRADGIFQVPAAGGTPKLVIATDLSKGERGIGGPQLLPGGKALLFSVLTDDGLQIVVQRLASGERHILLKGDDLQSAAGYARYFAPGWLVYSQAATLLAAPLNVDRLEVTGPPLTIALGAGNVGPQFSLSRSAQTLVYVHTQQAPPSTLVWVDRKGVEEPLGAVPGRYSDPRLSSDGKKVALAADSDIWVYDLARRTLARITFAGDNRSPVWTPDGTRMTYSRNGALSWSLADGSSHEERLWSGDNFALPSSWSPDGKRVLFTDASANSTPVISMLSVEGERKPIHLLQSRFPQMDAVFSPDGLRFAYCSTESGRPEIYVQEFAAPGGKVQVSSEGGTHPVWARQGRELFYLNGDSMMAVDVTSSPAFHAASPRILFERRYSRGMRTRNYDVSADGQRFLMVKSGGAVPPVTQLNVVLNWFGDVKRSAPMR